VITPELMAFGDLMADHYFMVDGAAREGTKQRARYVGAYAGGMAGNVARLAAQAGVRCGIVTSVGRDEIGSRLLRELADCGVDTKWASSGDEPTGRTVIMLFPSGERTVLLAPGEHVKEAVSRIDLLAERPRLVYTNAVELAGSVRLARACRESGFALVCDIEEHEAEANALAARELASCATLVACSEHTAAVLGPRPAGTFRLILAGSDGLRLLSDAGEIALRPPSGPVVDTTGGGDAAVAACCRALLDHASSADMASTALAASAKIVGRLGVGDRLDL
jgi:sugar/nucleoside kinase (ribokinase family)